MARNESPEGILPTLIRYAVNVAVVGGGLVSVAGLLFIMVVRANPSAEAVPPRRPAASTSTPPAQSNEPAATAPAAAGPEVVALGAELFQSQGCGACHTVAGVALGVVGPDLTDVGVRGEEVARQAGLANAQAYIRQSIVEPNAFIAPDCPTGPCPPGAMPATFGQLLTDEQLNALVQYLLTLKGGG